MELNQLLQIVRRRWGVAVLSFLLVIGIGMAAAFLPEKRYDATAALLARPDAEAVEFGQVPLIEFLIPPLGRQVESDAFKETVEASLPAALVGQDYEVSSSNDPGSGILEVTVSGPDADAVAPLANRYADQLVIAQPVQQLLTLTVIDPASKPDAPAAPAQKLILAAAGVLGLMAAVFVPLLANSLWKRLEGAEQIRNRFGTSVLGEVPKLRRRRGHRQVAEVLNDRDNPATTEAFHRLRTSVELALTGSEPRAIAVTSVHTGEGKSTLAATLAWALAAAGSRVTLIDADLRRPRAHELLGEPFGPGVSSAAGNPLYDVVQPTREPNLTFVPAGAADRHPAEVVTVTLPAMLDHLERERRLVIVDTPPLRGVAETNILAAMAGAVILVVDARHYDEQALEQAIYQLHEAGTRVLGVVINRARLSRTQRHLSQYYAARPYATVKADRADAEETDDATPAGLAPPVLPPPPRRGKDVPADPEWPRSTPGAPIPGRPADETREVH